MKKTLTPQRAINRAVWDSSAHRKQRQRVWRRDGYTCVDCGYVDETKTGRGLVAHHVNGIDRVREFDDRELATRCRSCSGRKDGGRRRRR